MMSDHSTTIEIEDVLSSIRRLVSQDTALRQSAIPHRSPVPERRPAATDPAAALLLTPAQRVSREASPLDAMAEAPPLGADTAHIPEEPVAELATAEPQSEPIADEHVAPEQTWAPEPEAAPTPQAAGPEEPIWAGTADDAGFTADVTPPSDAEISTETATEIAAEISTETAADAFAEAAPETAPEAGPQDLGDELTRLETKIAEMEAAVAESGVDFEPEQGHPFAPEGAAPLQELPEEFDAGAFAPQDTAPAPAEETFSPARPDWQIAAEEAGQDAGLPPLQDIEVLDEMQDAHDQEDPDLRHESWVRSDRADWADDLRAETEEAVCAAVTDAAIEELRHLSLEDAVEAPFSHVPRESSYQALRDDLAFEEPAADPADEGLDLDAAGVPFDEADLRALVGDIIRQELQGALGERITRNVRKLVRREIQRALLSRDMG